MLSQDDYQFFTGEPINFDEKDWERLVSMAATRLAGFLCLESLEPETGEPLTTAEYDSLNLSAAEYDAKDLTADEYDHSGKTILMLGGVISLPDDLAMLLANFICLMLGHRGKDTQVEEKRIRNFTIRYGNFAASAFAKLSQNYGDIIEEYSRCGLGVCVERNAPRCCSYGHF